MKLDELKPCPFCGSRNLFTERPDLSCSAVMCNDCGIMGPEGQPLDDRDLKIEDELDLDPGHVDAIRRWNSRYDG